MLGFGLTAGLVLTSCSDEFLQDKQNYDNVDPSIYDDYTGAKLRVNDIYIRCLSDINAKANWRYTSSGNDDEMAKSTEEYSGFGEFVNPQNPLFTMSGTAPTDYFFGSQGNIRENTYGHIRNINDVIEGISNGSLSQEEKDELLGQCYFFRAWRYYNMVKLYGGVPIVTEVQDPVVGVENPRNTTKDCIDFMLSDLDKAAKLLAAKTMSGSWSSTDYGRVTTGTALALKGRVLLLWASPLFNRSNDKTRWENAYRQMSAELDSINACGYGLYTEANNINGSSFGNMFNQRGQNPEAVFVTLYNNSTIDGDQARNSSWERYIRPSNTSGSGKTASAMLIDMFPMADGKRPTTTDTYTKLEMSSYAYDREHPFMNRDPRFYRTFAFPGFRWAFNGNSTLQDDSPNNPSYDNGTNYVLWNYVWYTSEEDRDNDNSSNNYGADNLLGDVKGVYVRKRSDDLDLNNSPLYSSFDAMAKNGGFAYSAQPYMEIRYAEVLLNLAEVACGANQLTEAVNYLKQIRQRAGYTAENNYGLQTNLESDQAACMSAILYERQIEFAYEGKRFDDMRRWMLFDGGTGKVEGAPSTWTLTGWGGNTCTWLGFKPFNGQRRENMEFRVNNNHNNGLGGTTFDSDPLSDVERCAGVDLRQELAPQLETLKAWYEANLERKDKKGDSRDQNQTNLYINFLPRYYFFGIPRGAQSNMKAVSQTIGWEDYNNGGRQGTYDPLAE